MFYQLPPVGNPVCLIGDGVPRPSLDQFFSPLRPRYYASGTAALAAAITAAIRHKGVTQPEVLLPAYGCPDLVSAAVYAAAEPVLVDLEPDRPWMDLEHLQGSINSNTVAVIAASLCGIPERMIELRSIADEAGVVLIEDSAQAFRGEEEADIWSGDLVVLSFGRGKPVSLLGGGAVLFRECALSESLPAVQDLRRASRSEKILFHLKARLYNRMISPRLYWLPQGLPFLHLGETRYHPLEDIAAMNRLTLDLLPANIMAYRKHGMQVQHDLAEMLEATATNNLVDLPKICQVARERRLLRYPLLVDAAVRDKLYQQLRRMGLGPSVMYPSILPAIKGLEAQLHDQGAFPAAESFAARILTLPTHMQVRQDDLLRMSQLLSTGR